MPLYICELCNFSTKIKTQWNGTKIQRNVVIDVWALTNKLLFMEHEKKDPKDPKRPKKTL